MSQKKKLKRIKPMAERKKKYHFSEDDLRILFVFKDFSARFFFKENENNIVVLNRYGKL